MNNAHISLVNHFIVRNIYLKKLVDKFDISLYIPTHVAVGALRLARNQRE